MFLKCSIYLFTKMNLLKDFTSYRDVLISNKCVIICYYFVSFILFILFCKFSKITNCFSFVIFMNLLNVFILCLLYHVLNIRTLLCETEMLYKIKQKNLLNSKCHCTNFILCVFYL